MLRIMAFSRNPKEVLFEKVKRHCRIDDRNANFLSPTVDAIRSARIVVATLCCAGKLVNYPGISSNLFNVVAIDECGQAQEPETLAGVSPLLKTRGQLILAGDPKQLGPIVHSSTASKFGLGLSLLERLFKFSSVYQKNQSGVFDSRVVAMLDRNYRSHPELIRLPNQMFYSGEITCHADQFVTGSLLNYDDLVTRGVPLIFEGVRGDDQREGDSPSWFNSTEAEVVLNTVRKLLNYRQGGLRQEHIGVIAPYNKQVQKISRLLKGADLMDVKW